MFCFLEQFTFGVVLAREGTTTVSTPTAISVDNNFSACKTSITLSLQLSLLGQVVSRTLRATNNKSTRWLNMINCIVVEVLFGDNGLDDFLLELGNLIGKFDVF